ncbi:elongator complex protein 2-like [Saccostrea cucullata]|uniref:elongator complex protein 2-like n=1 Tax=Saccostrea cuccullata TaxID=36930 RepID=UPI002ED3C673
MMGDVKPIYISCGCNRTPQCVDWSTSGTVCYGACHAVAIYHPEGYANGHGSISHTLVKHTGRVNCVKWIRNTKAQASDERFVSGSVDKTAIVWKKSGVDQVGCFLTTLIKYLYFFTITTVNGIETTNQNETYIVTGSTDSQLMIWKDSGSNDFTPLQSLSFGTGFVLDVSLICLPTTGIPLLACGCDDHKIHLYSLQDDCKLFQLFNKVISLQGHEDWVRAVDFCVEDSGDVMLASAGQDYLIRIWRLSRRDAGSDEVNKSVQELSIDDEIKMRENTFSFTYKKKKQTFAVSLESVLSGHENWIYSIRWQPPVVMETSSHQPMKLLSASMDKTMIIWMPDPESGVWIEQVRVGEVGGYIIGCALFVIGRSIIAHGYQGAFHQWSYNETSNQWRPVVTGSGHFDEVEDLGWDTGGQFVMTVSKDQTTRLHAPTIYQQGKEIWYEIARPQVHGYDLQCLAIINRYKFASGADEKVIRAFEAPRNFIENFCTLCGKDLTKELQKEEAQNRPEGASVPALGLSNKAVFGGEKISDDREMQPHPNDQYPEVYFSPMTLTEPPTEEQLLQNTLWPETQKLYGHGYEIFSLASDPAGKILASSCKAAKAEFAGIILWDTTSWTQLCTLSGHTLTVTQMAFSPCGNFLLSVSRDRTWAVYSKKSHDQPESDPLFTKLLGTDKKSAVHSRIIWSCAWSPDSKRFFTASRDKKIIVWQNPGLCEDPSSALQPVDSVTLSDSVTAVDVSRHTLSDNRHLLAAGLDNGRICLYMWRQAPSDSWQLITELDQAISHHLTVKRIQFSPDLKDNNIQQFASCSLDHCVKIYRIDRTKL